jgi:hypothetical protein
MSLPATRRRKTMVEISKYFNAYLAEVTVNGIYFSETAASPIAAFLAISEAVEFEFGRVVSLGISYK